MGNFHFELAGDLHFGRYYHAASLALHSFPRKYWEASIMGGLGSDGKVLTEPFARIETYDISENKWWCSGGKKDKSHPPYVYSWASLVRWDGPGMTEAGKVMIAGGINDAGTVTNGAYQYDPNGGLDHIKLQPMLFDRAFHTSGFDISGDCLPRFFYGGYSSKHGDPTRDYRILNNGEYFGWTVPIYPYESEWSLFLGYDPRFDHTTTQISNNRYLITGGYRTKPDVPRCQYIPTSEILAPLDPYTVPPNPTPTYRTGVGPHIPRYDHAATTIKETDEVLIAGGCVPTGEYPYHKVIGSCEIYDPATDTWTFTGSLNAPRYDHTMHQLLDGTVVCLGGVGVLGNSLDTVETWDRSSGQWTLAGTMRIDRYGHQDVELPDHRILIAGGYSTIRGECPTTCELLVQE